MRNKPFISSAITITLVSVMVMVSCTHKSAVLPDVSFSKDIIPIFQASCALNGGCHSGATNNGHNMDFDSNAAYNTIITKQLVIYSNPTASLLYVQISSGIMPKSPYPILSADKINLVLNWIKQGAKP